MTHEWSAPRSTNSFFICAPAEPRSGIGGIVRESPTNHTKLSRSVSLEAWIPALPPLAPLQSALQAWLGSPIAIPSSALLNLWKLHLASLSTRPWSLITTLLSRKVTSIFKLSLLWQPLTFEHLSASQCLAGLRPNFHVLEAAKILNKIKRFPGPAHGSWPRNEEQYLGKFSSAEFGHSSIFQGCKVFRD